MKRLLVIGVRTIYEWGSKPIKAICEGIRNCNCRICLTTPPKLRFDPLTCLKRLFLLLIIPRIMATVVFAIYDWRCIIFMEKPAQNCTLDRVLGLGDAVSWIETWLSLSIVSSLILIIVFICDDDFTFIKEKWKNICKKGSFFSLLFLMVLTSVFYIIRLASGKKVLMSLLFVLWVPTITVLICVVNFVPQVLPQANEGGGAGKTGEVNGRGGAGEAGEVNERDGAGEAGEVNERGGAGEAREVNGGGGAGKTSEVNERGGAGRGGNGGWTGKREVNERGGAGKEEE
ncbi:uncharacterized protein LOC124443334 [Xenia sp. Carnegie-2017]|uniref:uncharacterized protein LOC124443334 n=1 Tax=Xenia sp. Carnegie-2017 TaxID=2897299 RepID=UPI001F0470C4|nr:uncharacterized protein LOC124443334 [Xenia sp. Carnegie-2017]